MRNLKIEVGKYYRTGHGEKVRIYATDGSKEYPMHGAVLINESWISKTWKKDGRFLNGVIRKDDITSEWQESLDFDPSCLPAWSNWIAMDENGRWFHYFNEPEINDKFNRWGSNGISGYIPNYYCPMNFSAGWKDSFFSVDELKNKTSYEK